MLIKSVSRSTWELFLFSACLCSLGCSSSEEEDSGPLYVQWEGSANGEWVIDGQGNRARFLMAADLNDYIEWQSQTYNIYMNHFISSRIYSGDTGEQVGSVINTTQGGRNVAGLVGTNGNFLLLGSNPDGSLHIETSDIVPAQAQVTDPDGTAGGSIICSDDGAHCTSICTGTVPEQACLYCQAACLCDCAQESCGAGNRASAAQLGTTCPQ